MFVIVASESISVVPATAEEGPDTEEKSEETVQTMHSPHIQTGKRRVNYWKNLAFHMPHHSYPYFSGSKPKGHDTDAEVQVEANESVCEDDNDVPVQSQLSFSTTSSQCTPGKN